MAVYIWMTMRLHATQVLYIHTFSNPHCDIDHGGKQKSLDHV
jgi:hypothetical protein